MPDDARLRPGDVHPLEELPDLLNGELSLDELGGVVIHLRHCRDCQAELVEVAGAAGALRHVERAGMADMMEPPALPQLTQPPRTAEPFAGPGAAVTYLGPRRRRILSLAAAVLVLVAAGLLVGRAQHGRGPTVKVAFTTLGSQPAQGSVEMSGSGASRTMRVTATLSEPAPGTYYEVWLLDVRSGGMVAVGVLPTGHTAQFALPTTIVARYNAVDISLQPDNGSTVHSNDSVLRATYSV